jgi:predicted DCC family thiol-disulfide oxidoreductase YuxK
MPENSNNEVWLVYDGDCPICKPTANALKIRAAVGTLHLVNAREPHLLEEIKKAQLNLDEGMVVKFKNTLYCGADAQYVLAMIGTKSDWFNRVNVLLFRSQFIARLVYPLLRNARNMLLKMKGITKLNNLGKLDE